MSILASHIGSTDESATKSATGARRATPSIFLGLSALALLPWSVWLARSLPCRYLTQHWGIAWAGFDLALATALSLTSIAALRWSPWLDRVATVTATLLVTDAWFDIITSRGAGALALALGEAVVAELPIAFLCLQLARRRSRAPVSHLPSQPGLWPSTALRMRRETQLGASALSASALLHKRHLHQEGRVTPSPSR